jgi:hypothetical protein
MAQVSNVKSRTLRINGSLSESVKTTLLGMKDVTLLQKDGEEGKSKCFITAEEVTPVIELLSSNNVAFRPHFYSLFAKFNQELKTSEVSKLNEKITEIAPNCEISYSRIDENGHTGKIVLDRFEDYNALRAFTGELSFYKFNRTKAQSRMGARRPNNAEGAPRAPRQPRTQQQGAVNAAPADGEGWEKQVSRPGRQAARGRGGAQRGRPARAAPKPVSGSAPAPNASS